MRMMKLSLSLFNSFENNYSAKAMPTRLDLEFAPKFYKKRKIVCVYINFTYIPRIFLT